MRRVVVTGMGVVAPGAADVGSFGERLASGTSSVRSITRFDAGAFPVRIAAEVDESLLRDRDGAELDRIARFGTLAAADAIRDAGLTAAELARAGVSFAAGFGSYDHEEVFVPAAAGEATPYDWRAFAASFAENVKPRVLERRTPGSVAALVARLHAIGGPVISAMTACAAGTQAIGDAARMIRLGDAEVVVAGAADSEIYPMGVASFCLLRALSTRNEVPEHASRPFSRTRDGFVLGEGAGALVLEELEHARSRGATVLAEVLGFGSACDSYRVTDPHPDGVGAVLAMQRALRQASLDVADVDYLNAHGTSTPLNDRIETRAVHQLFGDHATRVALSSTKSMIGHLTVAAGAVEAIATILSIRSQLAFPTINLDERDPECDLDYVPNEARATRIDVALSNSFAFGGQCASLLLGRYEA